MALRTLTQVCWDRDAMALLSSSNDNHIKISLYVKWRVRQPRGGADTPPCAEPEPPAAAGRQQLAPGRGEEAILCCGPRAGRAGATRLTRAPRSAERRTRCRRPPPARRSSVCRLLPRGGATVALPAQGG